MQVDWEKFAAPDDKEDNSNKIDWEKFSAPEKSGNSFDINSMPWFVKAALNLAPEINKPMSKALPERGQALIQGFKDIGQGAKQAYLTAGNELGFSSHDDLADYNQKTEEERKKYEESDAAKDPIGQLFRSGVSSVPEIAALGPLGMEASIIPKILTTAATSGAAKGLEYVPPGSDRIANIAKGVAEGVAFPLVEKIPSMIASGLELPGKIKSGLKNATSDLTSLKQEFEQAANKADEDKQAFNSSKYSAEANPTVASSNPSALERKIANHQANIADIDQQLAQLPENLDLNTGIAAMNSKDAENAISNATDVHDNAKAVLSDVDQSIGEHLNQGASHRTKVEGAITSRVNSVMNFWKDSYQNFLKKIKDAEFHMPEEAMSNLNYDNPSELIKKYGNEAYVAIRKGKLDDFLQKQAAKESPENPFYKKLLTKAPTSQDTNASDFLAKFKDFRDELFELSQKMRSDRIDEADKLKIKEARDKGLEMRDQMQQVLDKGLGEYKPEFDWLNQGYREQVYPLRDNPVVEKAKNGKLSSTNMIDQLNTNEVGMPLVRQMIKEDPEALKNLVGQRYKINPDEVHYPNEAIREYTNEMPELNNLANNRSEVLDRVNQAKQKIQEAKNAHAEAKNQENDAVKQLEKKQLLDANKKALQDQIEEIDRHLSILKKEKSKSSLSLGEKVKAEDRYNKALQKKLIAQDKLKTLAKWGIGSLVGYQSAKWGSRLLNNMGENS